MRVLVVEDEVKMAGLLKRGLEEEGYAVDVLRTGTDALWAGAENPYDAIVLDVMLPDLDGFEVCRQLSRPATGLRAHAHGADLRYRIASPGSMPALTTICRSRSHSASCSPACAPSSGAVPMHVRPSSVRAISPSILRRGE